jgi:hypothetical protein
MKNLVYFSFSSGLKRSVNGSTVIDWKDSMSYAVDAKYNIVSF